MRSLTCILGFLTTVATSPAQKPDIKRLFEGLDNDVTWSRDAAHLVLLGAVSAHPLMECVANKADKGVFTKQFRRVLIVLDRLGMDGEGGAVRLRDMMGVFLRRNGSLAIDVYAQIYPAKLATPRGLFKASVKKRLTRSNSEAMLESLERCRSAIEAKLALDGLSVDELAKRLARCSAADRNGLCQLLSRQGKKAARALPVLMTKLQKEALKAINKPPAVSELARDRFGRNLADTILKIAPGSEEAGYAHAYLVHADSIPDLRFYAGLALAKFGRKARRGVPLLVAFLKRKEHASETLTCAVIDCVAAIGPEAAEAIPHLERLKASKNKRIVTRVNLALAALRPPRRVK